jgi:hypothetical protein
LSLEISGSRILQKRDGYLSAKLNITSVVGFLIGKKLILSWPTKTCLPVNSKGYVENHTNAEPNKGLIHRILKSGGA